MTSAAPPTTPAPTHPSKAKPNGCAIWFIRGLVIAFLPLPMLLMVYFTIIPLANQQAATDWVAHQCTLEKLHIDVSTTTDSDGHITQTYNINSRYHYTWQQQRYTGDQFALDNIGSSDRALYSAALAPYRTPVVTPYAVDCYVNPATPEEAVIERRLLHSPWWGLLGIAFLAGLIGTLWVLFKKVKIISKTDAAEAETRYAAWRDAESERREVSRATPETLKASFKPQYAKVIGLILIVIGITANIGIALADGNLTATALACGSILIGIGVAIYGWMISRNPSITITLADGNLPAGDIQAFNWQLSGPIERLEQLTITLVLEKRTTRNSGKHTRVEIDKLAEHSLATLNKEQIRLFGAAEMSIPSDAVPSDPMGQDGYHWWLKVHGEIHRWPDMRYQYHLDIY